MKVLLCFGTRPEIIKLAPMVHAMRRDKHLEPILCSTGQHQAMVSQMLSLFDLQLDEDLAIMQPKQTVESITMLVMQKLGEVLDRTKPDYIMVQGDTTSAFVSGLLGFYQHIPVLHLEAGLRSGDMQKPWPEEANRRLLSVLSAHHFAPTEMDAENLRRENIPTTNIHVVGNTVVDALCYIQEKIANDIVLQSALQDKFSFIDDQEKFILVTGHRRESHGGGHAAVFKALKRIAEEKQIKIVFPVHLNPQVKDLAGEILANCSLVYLLEPINYVEMQYLQKHCFFVITDSGGIQEEAPTYGKPLLVTREVTERMAGVLNGSAILVGTDAAKIFSEAIKLIDDQSHFKSMVQAGNPYGDGKTAVRVCEIIQSIHTRQHVSIHCEGMVNG